MPSITLHPPTLPTSTTTSPTPSPLPQLLQTPSGLAIIELQGTINLPSQDPNTPSTTNLGHISFPDYDASKPEDKNWMKRVYLHIGKYQRMTGEVKKLPKPLGVIRRREVAGGMTTEGEKGDLEIVDVVYWKVLFKARPEPVGAEVQVEEGDGPPEEEKDQDQVMGEAD